MLAMVMPLLGSAPAAPPAPLPPGTIDPLTIPKYVNVLDGPPPVYKPVDALDPVTGEVLYSQYDISMEDSNPDGTPIMQQILPSPLPATPIWGYRGKVYSASDPDGVYSVSAPGATFEAVRGVPIQVKWTNNIDGEHMFPVDPTLHWANPNEIPMEELMMYVGDGTYPMYPPGYNGEVTEMNPEGWNAQSPVPAVPHLHGAEVSSWYDGGPEAWYTSTGLLGPAYENPDPPSDLFPDSNSVLYKYPNIQPATTLWYHDHALGITRINVMSGLAGFYMLRDPADTIAPLLPSGKYEMPLVIQDRTFSLDGSFWFDTMGINPTIHPYWTPEFFGNTIMVNGEVWPKMLVDQALYRFRLLDGSNARFYSLSFSNGMGFTVIGSDGGYLKSPAKVGKLTIAPGGRYDVLVDFRGLAPGTKVLMVNSAKAPFPNGVPADANTVGQIMQFEVTGVKGPKPAKLPADINSAFSAGFPSLGAPTNTRVLTLVEVMAAGGPAEILLNGLKWEFEVQEKPTVGTTEEWVIVNPTADTHPIHLHLVQFQVVSRQKIDAVGYYDKWIADNGNMMPPFEEAPVTTDYTPFLKGAPKPADAVEMGWKDTVQMNPGEVTIIRVRFAPIDGVVYDWSWYYPFDPSAGPGYVWHCHILDHEDNEMMRPYEVKLAS